MIDINPIKIANDQVSPVDLMVADIQTKNSPQSNNYIDEATKLINGNNDSFGGSGIQQKKEKFSMEDKVNINQGYDLLGGDWMSKYPTFKVGRDNAEYAAQNQSSFEKWTNGTSKAINALGMAVVGGTAGIVYGAGAAIADQSWSSLYDNNLSNTINDWNTKLSYQLPNYYTKQEENAGVFGQVGTANFWADKFLGGLAFTGGAIVSEAIWGWATGGTSLATAGARLGGKIAGLGRAGRWGVEAIGEAGVVAAVAKNKSLFAKGLTFGTDAIGLTDDALRARKIAVAGGKIGEVASIAGRTMRSAGYEASVEALQYKKEAEENFYRNFASMNGREPNSDEVAKFKVENESTANTVFGFNMGIVGMSNLVGLGHVLNIKNPVNLGITDFINKKAFGYGIDAATNVVTKGTTKQIIARNAFDYLIKPSFTEGLFEEGLQGVTNKTANKWIEHTYNPKYTNESFSQVDSFYDAMQEQYGTEKGWKDNILGMLIGVAGGSTNVRGAQNQKNSELEFEAKAQSTYNNNTLQSMLIPARIQSANREAGFTEAANQDEKDGNFASAQINKIGALTSFANTGFIIGESVADMSVKLKTSLDLMTSEQWADAGISQENIEREKTDKITEFEGIANAWKTNKQYVQYMVGNNMVGEKTLGGTKLEGLFGSFSKNSQVVEALAWQLTVGEQSGRILKDTLSVIGGEIGVEHAKTIETINQKNNLSPFLQKRVATLQAIYNRSRVVRDSITQEIIKLDSLEPNDTNKKRRLTLTKRLLEAEGKLTKAEAEAQEIATTINDSENYKNSLETLDINSNIKTGLDLLNLDVNIKKFQSILEQQENLNPQRAQYLKELLNEHNTARDMFMQAKTTQKALVSKEFKTENIDGWLSKLFKNGKEMNPNAKEWFEDSINKYTLFQTELINGIKAISDAQEREIALQAEIETGKITPETLQEIADKENLTKQEQQIYNSNKEAIDELRAQKNLETKPKSQEQINQEKVDELEIERAEALAKVKPADEVINDENPRSSVETLNGLGLDSSQQSNLNAAVKKELIEPFKKIVNSIEELKKKFKSFIGKKIKVGNSVVEIIPFRKDELTQVGGRFFIKVIINGIPVTFYQSTGLGGKTLQTGRFYPTLGVEADERINGNWVNKIGAIEMASYYGSNELAKVGAFLDNTFGNLSDFTDQMKTKIEGIKGEFPTKEEAFGYRKLLNLEYINSNRPTYEGLAKDAQLIKDDFKNIINQIKNNQENTTQNGKSNEESLLDGVSTIGNEEQKRETSTKLRTQETVEKEKIAINKAFDLKVNALKPQSENSIEQYKQRINKMFNELYDDLDMVNQEDLEAERPTEQEINEYKNNPTEALKKKLQNWLLLDASTDDGYTSIVDLLDLINQHETKIEEITTKDEVNEEDVKDIVAKSDGGANTDKKDVTNISTEPIVAKRIKKTENIQLSHIKASYILTQIGKEYKQKREGKYMETPDANNMQVGDVIEVDNMSFSMVENYRLEFKEEDFISRQQLLNLYIEESQNFYGNMSVYTVLGDERVKAPSQFQDDVLNREAAFRIKIGDELTLAVNDLDNWNKSKKGGTQNEFKIYLKDKEGNHVQVLKSGETKFGSDFDEKFAELRLKAFENWEAQGRPDVMDLGITLTVKDVLLAAPELLFSDGKLIEGDINFDETQKVIIAKGYIESGKITLDNEVGEVSKVYVGRMTKNNPNLKIPIVVFKVGANTIAFPITMKKSSEPIEFEALLQGTPQEIVKKINQAIIDNSINAKKLVFSDINITPSGEMEMSETAQKAKEAFANNTTFVTADTLAEKSYKTENLVKDATIRINLTDVEKVFSAPKVVIDVAKAVVKQSKPITDRKKLSIDDKAVELLNDLREVLKPEEFLRDEATDFFDDIADITHGELDIKNKNLGVIQKTGLKNKLNSVLDRFFTQEGKKIKSILTTKEKNSMGEVLDKLYDYIKTKNNLDKQMQTNQKDVKEGLDNLDCNK